VVPLDIASLGALLVPNANELERDCFITSEKCPVTNWIMKGSLKYLKVGIAGVYPV
jgi:hypothetical protein